MAGVAVGQGRMSLLLGLAAATAGSTEMPMARFTAPTAAGSLLWNAVLIGAGIALGSNWHVVERVVGRTTTVIAVTVVLLAGALVARWLSRHRDA